ncbi:hypothetical protein EYF80_009736 [Liparis tanakae]|uniref:Uncharacterized protein n=1 Tax=Liparis tanakae TaxID=230148 RepID=A0A4Z2IRC6_9TELE|nr:hypothetical protein EYF80_009736 [Liparis tanakae]
MADIVLHPCVHVKVDYLPSCPASLRESEAGHGSEDLMIIHVQPKDAERHEQSARRHIDLFQASAVWGAGALARQCDKEEGTLVWVLLGGSVSCSAALMCENKKKTSRDVFILQELNDDPERSNPREATPDHARPEQPIGLSRAERERTVDFRLSPLVRDVTPYTRAVTPVDTRRTDIDG